MKSTLVRRKYAGIAPPSDAPLGRVPAIDADEGALVTTGGTAAGLLTVGEQLG